MDDENAFAKSTVHCWLLLLLFKVDVDNVFVRRNNNVADLCVLLVIVFMIE